MHTLGHTRSRSCRDHLLQTPDTSVRTPLPGMVDAAAIVHIAPAGGAGFTQYTAELDRNGSLGPTSAQRFVYVLSGEAQLLAEGQTHPLGPASYAFLPAGCVHTLQATEPAILAVIEKPYIPYEADAADHPAFLVGHENTVTPAALLGDEALQVRALLPDTPAFDFAVNTMTYQPGASLGMVEVHINEHGLLMLNGGGIYLLGDAWYPVTAGDFIWMAPFCPQWFGALGKQPAKYLIYKDCHRHPLS